MDNIVVSNIRQRPIRTLVSVAGVALGVCLVMLFTGLARGMSNDMERRATNMRANGSLANVGDDDIVHAGLTIRHFAQSYQWPRVIGDGFTWRLASASEFQSANGAKCKSLGQRPRKKVLPLEKALKARHRDNEFLASWCLR